MASQIATTEQERLVVEIVEAVAAADDTSPVALEERLCDAVEPDALEALLASSNGSPGTVIVTFEFAGHRVTVSSEGRLDVE